MPGHVRGDGVAQVFVSKSIPAATVAVIDPESGTSSGGAGSSDVRLAVGDIILFRFNYFPVPEGQIRGIQGYLTEFVPPGTEVVGFRYIDSEGRTILPNYPGLANDGCARPCNGYASVPCNPALGFCSAAGRRSLADGSMAQLHADTGIFYTTDTRLTRTPGTAFITLTNGITMTAQPTRIGDVAPILQASAPFFAHADWDYVQVRAYGISNASGNASGNNGTGNTPFLYGSPVAGPQTYYRYEATLRGGVVEFNDVVGPWQRIRSPGSLIGTGIAATGTGSMARTILDASSMGTDVTPATPLPLATRALRAAMGEVRVGEVGHMEIALRVRAVPIDPVQMQDVDCAEVFGGDTSARSDTTRARDNPWGVYLASPACVFLNLLFDLEVDDTLAVTGNTLTYTLSGRNLSTNPQTTARARQKFDGTRVSFVSATGSPSVVPNCDGDGLDCLVWNLGTLAPSATYSFTSRFTVGGGGHVTNIMRADYRSDQLPTGFRTQAISLVRAAPLVHLALAPVNPVTAAGGTAPLSGTLTNDGSGQTTVESIAIVLPGSAWRVTGPLVLGGTSYACSSGCATSTPSFTVNRVLNAESSLALSLSATVPAGTSTALHDIDVQVWASTMAFGGSYETYFPDAARVPVGQRRSDPPVLDCPILSSASRIRGSTTEADGTDVRVFFSLIQRGIDTDAAGGRFDVGTFGVGSPFGTLYGGLEVRATAQAPGELESPLSEPCFVTFVNQCQDGIDNDGDGLIDFPADPGCSGPTDSDESDPQCSNGIDDDMDGSVDFPADPECSSADDNTEGGPPACGDGIDNDGDGRIDFPADPGCASAADRDESERRACGNGIDDDGDGFIDFGGDAGCHSVNDDDEREFAYAVGDVRPRILLVFDTSGSMNWHVCADEFTGGDGSIACPGMDVSCATCAESGCGNAQPDDSRNVRARRGVSHVIAG